MMAYEEIISLLNRKSVSFKIHEHDPVTTIEDAEKKAPTLVRNLLKTVVFKIKDSFWILAAVPCHERIDYRKLAASLGVNRRQLRSLSPEEVEAELGFQVGGVGPIPWREDMKAVFDSSLLTAKTVFCGSGKNTLTLELRFEDLLRATEGAAHAIIRQ